MSVTTEAGGAAQAFDLNIEKVLEHWTIPFAIRELIANALMNRPSPVRQTPRFTRTAPRAGISATLAGGCGTST